MVWGFFYDFYEATCICRNLQSVNTKCFHCTSDCWDELTQYLVEKKLVGVFKTLVGYTNLLGTYGILHVPAVMTLTEGYSLWK